MCSSHRETSLNVDTLKDMTVKVGEPIELYVEMSGSPAPTVEWSKGSAKVSESDRVQVITTPRDATLLINHAQMGDTSSYKINVNNKHGSQTASVNVKVIGEYNLLFICEEGFITMWRCHGILRIDTCWLYLSRRKKKNQVRLIHGMRFLLILFKLVKIWGIGSCNGTRFRIRWKINILFNSALPHGIEHAKSHTIAWSTIRYLYIFGISSTYLPKQYRFLAPWYEVRIKSWFPCFVGKQIMKR